MKAEKEYDMKNRVKGLAVQFAEMMLGVMLVSVGLSFMIKSGLGQTAITSCTQNIAAITGIKGGTMVALLHGASVLLQILMQGKQFEPIQLFQFAVAWLQGKIVNAICYDLPVISSWQPGSYPMQWVCMLAAIAITAYGVTVTMAAEFVRMPFEQFAFVLSERLHMKFSVLRTRCDMVALALSLALVLAFHLDFTTLREGTWASMLLLGHCMGWFLPVAMRLSPHQRMKKAACSVAD